jgi:hypothetical protein
MDTRIFKLFSPLLIVFLLVFTADAQLRVVFIEDRTETSSENHREGSPDESICRISNVVQVRIANQLRFTNCCYAKQPFGANGLYASVLKKPAVDRTSPVAASIILFNTVLRI